MKNRNLVTFLVLSLLGTLFFVGGVALEYCNPDANYFLQLLFKLMQILGGCSILDSVAILIDEDQRRILFDDSVAEDNVEIEDDVFPDE